MARECYVTRARAGQLLGRYLAYVAELQGSYEQCKKSMEKWVADRYKNDCGAVAAVSVLFKVGCSAIHGAFSFVFGSMLDLRLWSCSR